MDILASTLGNVDVVCIVKRRWEGAEKEKKTTNEFPVLWELLACCHCVWSLDLGGL
jgi:hypothetical protein